MKAVRIGIYGKNGHQVTEEMIQKVGGTLLASCGADAAMSGNSAVVYDTLEEMLADPRLQLISVCSPMRSEQAEDIKKILLSGRHVYAEKPCVMKAEDLDEILQIAREKNLIFCEMAGSFYEQPYAKARELVEKGILGEIVQVFVQKSYPYGSWRPQNEDADGGLLLQNAVYGLRFMEHVAGQEITEIVPMETLYGNPEEGELRMACSLQVRFRTGGIGTVIANYLNQPGTGVWGNEELRIFGTRGYLTTNPLERSLDVYLGDTKEHYEPKEETDLFSVLLSCIRDGKELPFSQEWLTHPTRKAIEARGMIR